ncbi:MAG: hypothetical protein ACR2ND_03385 [Solirubrobacteraceae bacterium]
MIARHDSMVVMFYVPNSELTKPMARAVGSEIEEVATALPAYAWWGGVEPLAEVWRSVRERWESDGSLEWPVTALRSALYFEHRRWNDASTNAGPEPSDVRFAGCIARRVQDLAVAGGLCGEDEDISHLHPGVEASPSARPTDMVLDAIRLALCRAPRILRAHWRDGAPRDEHTLQAALVEALATGLPGREPLSVHREGSAKLDGWPGVGRVDLVLGHEDARCWLELKWGALPNCAWDACKVAGALAEERAEVALLLAGADQATWEKAGLASGCEFFEHQDFETLSLRSTYEKWWRKWAKDVKTQPVRLVAGFYTAPVACVQMSDGERTWELRAVAVHSRPGWVAWEAFPAS